MADLSRLAAVTPQTMHRLVVGMERGGLVRRHRLDDDRKSLKVAITGKGAELLGRAELALMKEQDALLECFTLVPSSASSPSSWTGSSGSTPPA